MILRVFMIHILLKNYMIEYHRQRRFECLYTGVFELYFHTFIHRMMNTIFLFFYGVFSENIVAFGSLNINEDSLWQEALNHMSFFYIYFFY